MRAVYLESVLLSSVMLLQLFLTPYTKVEESFNLQAMYDLLYKPWGDVSRFDHTEFPGVVPRTFIGPLLISVPAMIPKVLLSASPFTMLLVVRASLGFWVVLSLMQVRVALCRRYSQLTAMVFTAMTAAQFHIMFYASRPLPNTFALVLSNLALADQLQPAASRKPYRSLVLLSVACALFRCELCLYILMTLVVNVVAGRISFVRAVKYGAASAVVTAVASIAVDSHFWGRVSYPELEVFYFNVVQNKSSAWGTQPFLWYLYNALPRALGGSYVLALKALFGGEGDVGMVVVPALLFVGAYSILPHKELRFIFYVVPVLNAAAAVGVESEVRRAVERGAGRKGGRVRAAVLGGFVAATLASSIAQTVVSSAASRWNYPAAHAMRRMHALEERLCAGGERRRALVHVDADSAMGGVSQFVQESYDRRRSCCTWRYSKREDVQRLRLANFSHLLWANRSVRGFRVVHVERAFTAVLWRRARIATAPHTFVHRNHNFSAAADATGAIADAADTATDAADAATDPFFR